MLQQLKDRQIIEGGEIMKKNYKAPATKAAQVKVASSGACGLSFSCNTATRDMK